MMTIMRKKKVSRFAFIALGTVMSLQLCAITVVHADPSSPSDPASLSADENWILEHTGSAPTPYEAQWSVLTTQVGDAVPEDYAGSMVGDGMYYIGFKAELPDVAKKILSQFPSEYVALTDLGFSLMDVATVTATIVGIIGRDAPGTMFEIAPSALSPEVIVTVDPESVPQVKTTNVTSLPPAPLTVDPSISLTAIQRFRLKDLASVLSAANSSAVQIEMMVNGWEAPVPVAAVAEGVSRGICPVLEALTPGHCATR